MMGRLVALWMTAVLLRLCSASQLYEEITGYLCIRPEFIIESNNEQPAGSILACADGCSSNQRCQAFSTADGPCQLFVFDRCSKSVRDCSCSRRGQVFVKQQPGLEPGALCPPGYGDDLCGVKYKVQRASMNWPQCRATCESESGLVIMADVVDATEMDHVEMMRWKYFGTYESFYLGGYQPAGSPEPSGGWYWVGCNIPIDSSLWATGYEPDNYGGNEAVVGRYYVRPKLADFGEFDAYHGTVCECVSPFN